MRRINATFMAACVAFVLFVSPSPSAEAGLVTVLNPSFEAVQLDDGDWDSGAIPHWVEPSNDRKNKIGTYNPEAGKFSSLVPDGENTAYLNTGWIYQDLAAVLQEGTYILQVDVGDRLDTSLPSFDISLRTSSDNEDLVSVSQDNISYSITDGTFETITLTYDALATDLKLGQGLRIVLSSADVQTNFDNVRLSHITSPEPSTIGMAASAGVFGLVWFLRRKRQTRSIGRV